MRSLLDDQRLDTLIRSRIDNLQAIAETLPVHMALIEAAASGVPVDRELLLRTTGLLLENLSSGLLSPRIAVSRDFWGSPLGAAIARAHARVVGDDEVMSQAEAAHALGVSREYVSQLVETGRVRTIVREAAAPRSRKQPREMVFRSSVEALCRRGATV